VKPGLWMVAILALLSAQDGQRGLPPGWPCVAGRPIDPTYLNLSESTGGQLFLFQKGEAAHSAPVMSASYTHPATVLRLVGNLNGTRDLEFPVDRSIESLLVLASLQCRKEILLLRPSGWELTASNSAESVDLAAGRILRVDQPEAGKWRVRLAGMGLFVLSILAKTELRLTEVGFSANDDAAESVEPLSRSPHAFLGAPQTLQLRLSGGISNLNVRLLDAAGRTLSSPDAPEKTAEGLYRTNIVLQHERFRILVTGEDSAAGPFQRMYPVLFSVQHPK